MRRSLNGPSDLLLRELVFRVVCRHRQGPKPNIVLYCLPRSGSTWVLNTVQAHAGVRSVGRVFMSAMRSRYRRRMPNPSPGGDRLRHFVHFEGDDLRRFETAARHVLSGRWVVYPSLNIRAPYFHRKTDRVIFQTHTIGPMIEWVSANVPVCTVIALRHPIPTALSSIECGWRDEAADLLEHPVFAARHLTPAQVALGGRILRSGSPLERHVLDFSLRMLVPLRAYASGRHPDWLLLHYEDLVCDPEGSLRRISAALDLPDIDAMRRQIALPSRTVTPRTAARLHDQTYLLDRWLTEVSPAEAARAMEIPAAFGIHAYDARSSHPRKQTLVPASTLDERSPVPTRTNRPFLVASPRRHATAALGGRNGFR